MYSFAAEFLALFIAIMIFFFTCKPGTQLSKLRKWFLTGIIINISAILVDFITLQTIGAPGTFPMWLNYLINTLYYALCFTMTTLYTAYLVQKLLFHITENSPAPAFVRGLFIGLGSELILLVVNLATGIIFYYDQDLVYTRGPLWILGYLQLVISTIVIVVCITKYGLYIDHEGKRLGKIGVPTILLFIVYQIIYPDILLNGSMGAFTAMLCFLSFETHSEDVDSVSKRGNLSAFMKDLELYHRNKKPYQTILISFRNYSSLNATFGFLSGNEILFRAGNYLEDFFPQGKVYRFAPVTFAVLVPYEDADSAKSYFEESIANFPSMTMIKNLEFHIQPYFVNMENPDLSFRPSQIVEMLEYAKEYAKQNYIYSLFFDEKMQQQFQRKKYLISYLQKCVEEHKFEMWYQPIYCTSTQKFCSSEALLRLKDEDGSFISPEEFVPIAEEIGLIDKISHQTVSSTIEFLSQNPDFPIKQISINLALQQLQIPDHIESLFRLMDEKKVSRDKIGYEITERMLISNDSKIKKTLDKMIKDECTFLLDDFGTGYSNFTSVLDYPFQKIKLDKSLLWNDTSDDYHMVSMMIRLFHEFGKQVVVEGVETKEQVEALTNLGADFLQGFYFSRPICESEYMDFVLKNSKDPSCEESNCQ